jgi:hypothetical protein
VWHTVQLTAIFSVGRMEVHTGGQWTQNTVENKREDSVIHSKYEFDVHHSFIMMFIIIFLVAVFTCLTIYILSIVVYKCCFLGRVNKVRFKKISHSLLFFHPPRNLSSQMKALQTDHCSAGPNMLIIQARIW